MKIATFNANSIRVRLPIILDWLAENEPDVLAVQETKCHDDQFPASEFEDAGWSVVFHGQKSYNGVALISKRPLCNLSKGFDNPLMPDDRRIISGSLDDWHIVNVYVPNGTAVGTDKFEYKLKWLKEFRRLLDSRYRPEEKLLVLGDFNVAPTPDDVFDSEKHLGSIGHHPAEFQALNGVLGFGLTDLFRHKTKGPGHYTFWEFVIRGAVEKNLGWRIDHIYGTLPVVEKLVDCQIDKAPRMVEKPSDHTFVWAAFDE